MSKLVLITRPIEQARQFAEQVIAAGDIPLVHPLLHIQHIPTFFEPDDQPDALLLSSVQTVQQLHIPEEWLSLPTFCVGGMTAQAAQDIGLKNIYVGGGGMTDLCAIIQDKISPKSCLLYLRGENIHQDVHSLLPEYNIREIITYRAQPVTHFTPEVLDQFEQIDVVTLFSSRTAAILNELLEKNALSPYVKNIKLLCLSSSVLESVKEKKWKSIHIADSPTQTALLDRLKSI